MRVKEFKLAKSLETSLACTTFIFTVIIIIDGGKVALNNYLRKRGKIRVFIDL